MCAPVSQHPCPTIRSKPQERTDGHKVALVIEGGGMRGCVSAGMIASLADLGFGGAMRPAVTIPTDLRDARHPPSMLNRGCLGVAHALIG